MIKRYIQINTIVSLLTILSLILLAGLTYNIIRTDELEQSQIKTIEEFVSVNEKIKNIETILLAAQEENTTLAEALAEAKEKTKNLEDQFDDIDDTVGDLAKLSNLDPELLKKYSKVFFLNDNYAPSDLRAIPVEYVYQQNKNYQIHKEVWPFLKSMIDDAKDDDVDLQIISGFRSFGEQAVLKGGYTFTYGAGSANQFSADQGYSEHQLGTTVDFTNSFVGATFSGFAASETFNWLEKNAYKYGFILSYPQNNGYYQFEPWHWRFVGKKLARDLDRKGDNFYDWSQRDIDEYLIYLFD